MKAARKREKKTQKKRKKRRKRKIHVKKNERQK